MELQKWRAAAASVVGTSHVKTGVPCQDSHYCKLFNALDQEEVMFLSASDGAGSASHSDTGSRIACKELTDNIELFLADGCCLSDLTRDIVHSWFTHVVEAIEHTANANGHAPREYACTLLAALISPTHAAYMQIGDGAMVVRSGSDEWAYVFWPQHGEYINTTVFVTDPAALTKLEFDMRADTVHEIAAFTDGIESLVLHYATSSVHGPFFDRVFLGVRALAEPGYNEALSLKLGEYLTSQAICDRTDDDKTLVLASRMRQPPQSIVLPLDPS